MSFLSSSRNRLAAYLLAAGFAFCGRGAAAPVTWNGPASLGTWDTTSTNWNTALTNPWSLANGGNNIAVFNTSGLSLTAAAVYANGIVFTQAATISGGTINLAGSGPTIDGGGSISSVLDGIVGFTKTGSGVLTLGGTNTYSGGTRITGGTVAITSDGNLGAVPGTPTGSSIVIDSGILSTTGTFTLNANRGIAVGPSSGTGDGTINVSSGELTYNGVITSNTASGTGNLVKTGSGILTLGGTNLYTGNTVITLGTLKLASITALPSGSGKGDVTVNGTLDINANSITLNGLSGAGIITSGVAGVVTLTAGANNKTSTFSGIIQNGSGTLALTKTGSGTLTLSGSNTFTGGVTINGGALQLGSTTGLGATTNSVTFGPSAAVGTKLQLNGFSATVSSLATNATPGTVILENASASAATLTVNQSSTTTFAGVIQNGSGGGALGLTKSGTGTLTISGTNTYTGNTTITGGVLQAGYSLALPSGAGTGNVVIDGGASAGMLDLNGFDVSINGLTGVTGAVVGKVVNNLSATNKSLTVGSGNASTSFAGQILDHSTGTGTLNLIKTGSGTLTLTNTSTYSGATTIKNGVISLGVANALPTTTTLTLGDGTTNASGVLRLNGFTQSLAGLAIAGTGIGNQIVNGSATATDLTLNIASSSNFSGSFGGPGTNENNFNLIKSGTGTLTLSGSSTYTGATTISNGTLAVSNLATGGNLGSAATAVTLGDATNKGILSYGGNGDTFSRGFTLGAGGGEVDSTVSTKVLTIATGNITGSGLFTVGGAGDTSITSNITSSGGLSKGGLGTLTLSGANSFSGTTSILNGILALGVNNTGLNAATTLTLGDSSLNTNGVLKLSGFSQTLAGLGKVGNGTLNRVVGGNASLSNLTLNIGSTSSVNVALGGSGTNENNLSFTKFGTGTLTLNATNTYTGGTIIGDTTSGNNGILAVSIDANLGATGGVTINWSTLEITSSFSFTRSLTLSHANSAIWVDASQNFSTSGAITGTGALNLTGLGILTVSGTSNSWSGGTNIQNGTLALGATNALPTNTVVTMGTGTNSGILKLGGNSQTIGGLQISGSGTNKVVNGSLTASTLTIDNASTYSYAGVLGGAGTNENNFGLTKSNAGLLTLSGTNTYTGTTTINAGILALAGGSAIADTGTVSLANILGAGLQLNASETIGSLAGGGTTGGNLNLQSYILTVGGNNTSTSFAGVISGTTGSLVKAGTGTLTLSNSNTFAGGLTINGGGVQLANSGALNSTTPNSITFGASAAAGTKLQLNGKTVTIGALSTNATPGSPVIENANASPATLTVSQSTTTTFGGLLQDGSGGGALSFAKDGTGNLTIHNAVAATYTGSTSVMNGVLTLGGGGGNTLPTGTTVTLGTASTTTSGKLVLGDADNDNDDQTLSGLLTAGTGTTNTVAGGNATRTSTLTLNIAGTNLYAGILGGTTTTEKNLALVKTGTGTLTLSGTNTYTGTTTITGGTLSIGADANLGTAPGSAAAASIILNGATLSSSASFTLASNRGLAVGPASGSGNGTLDVATGANLIYTGIIANYSAGTGSLIKTGVGTLTLGGASTYTGGTSIQNGMLILSSGNNRLPTTTVLTLGDGATGSGVLKLDSRSQTVVGLLASGTGTNNRVINDNATLATFTVNNATDYSFAGILGGTTSNENNFAFTKSGTGKLTLSSANSYSGTTTVSTGGTLVVGNDAAIPSGTGTGNVSLAGTLDLNGHSITINGLTGAGGISSSVAGAVTLTVGANDATGLSYTGVIGNGTGTVSLTKIGLGTLTFGGASTYTGATTIKNGTLALSGAANRLPATTILTLGDSSTNTSGIFSLSGTSQTVGGLATAGTGTTNRIINGSATAATLTFTSSTDSSFGGILGGPNTNENNLLLTKSGSSTLTLTGTNTFTGLTTVSAGTLALSNGSALADTDAVSVSASATLLLNASETIGSLTGAGAVNLGTYTLTIGGDNTSPAAYSGAIAATTGSLVKIGTGTYTPSGSNLYTGTTTVAAGTLVANNLASGKNLGSASSAVILGDASNKGTLSYTGNSVSFTRGFTVSAGGGEVDTTTAGQTLTLATGGVATSGVFTIGGVGGTNISSAITGTGSLVKTGAGALILSNSTNGYSGGTTISQGLLLANTVVVGGTPLGTGNISVSSGANLSLSSKENRQGSQTITVNPNSGIGFANSALVQADLMTLFTDSTGGVGVLTVDSNFAGNGNYTNAINLNTFCGTGGTGGTWFLGSASTGTFASTLTPGGTTYRLGGGGGTLTISTNSTLTGAGNNLQVGFAGSNGNGTLVLGGTQTFGGTVSVVNTTLSVSNLASGGNLGTGGSAITLGDASTLGYLIYTGNSASFTRGFTINAGGGQIDTSTSAQTLTLATGVITANGLLTIGGIGNTTITSKITGTGGLTKTSTGTLTLSGNQNDFSGAVNINGGILTFSNLTDLGTGTAIGLSGGTLQWASGNTADVTQTTVSGTRSFTLGASGGTVNTGGNNVNFANAISGTGSFSKTGAGILTLSAVNAMGNITVSGGTLQLGIAGAIPTTSSVTLSGGSTFDINGKDATLLNLVSTATEFLLNSATSTSNTVTVNSGAATSFLGVIKDNAGTGGTLALAKSGTFALTLGSLNTYSGVTTITAGTLIAPTLANVNTASSIGKGSVSGSSADLVLNGGTLQFKGTTAQSTDRLFSIGTTAGSSLDASGTAAANTITFTNTGALGFAVDTTSSRTLTLTGTNTGANTFAPVIGDAAGGGVTSLTKSAAGTWVLTGANTYSGTTTISAGTLRIGNTAAIPSGTGKGNVSLAGTLDLNGNSITINGLSGAGTVTSGVAGAVGISVGGNNQTSAYTGVFNNGSGTVSLTKTGSGTLTLSSTTGTYSGGTTISGGILSIGADTNLGNSSGTLTIGAGTLQVSANIASSSRAITLTDAAAAISVASTMSFTTSGAITGSGMPLNLTGLGTLVVAGTSNTYSGGTNVQNGTLALGANNSLPLGTTVTLGASANSGILKLNGYNQEIAGLAVSGSGGSNKVIGGSASSSTLTLNLPGTASFGGVLGGVGTNENNFGFTKSGAGTLTLTGANTYTGTTTVSAGTLALSGGAAIADASAVSLANTSGATLLLNASETIGSLAGGGTTGGNVNLQANTLTVGGDNTSTTFYGVISGTGGSLTKTGTGTLLLHSASSETYSGTTTVLSGSLQLGGGAGSILPTGTVVTLGTASSSTAGKLILGDGDNDNDDQTLAGLLVASGNTGTNYVVGGNASRTSSLTLNIDTTNTYAGVLGGTTATENNLSLTKTGAGTLTLTGTNTYTGGTTITNGILSIGADANVGGSPGSATPNSIVINGGTLSTSASFTLNANRGISVGPSTGSGSGTLDVAAGTTLTYGGIIANNGSGIGGLTKTNTTGILILSGANTYTGDTTINGGTLQLGSATAIPSGTGKGNVSLVTGSTLDVNNFSATVNGLSGAGTVTNGLAGASTFSVGAGDATSSFGGVVQDGNGTLSLTKVGNGTLTLAAVQTYSGATTLSVGTLKLGIANALPSGFGKGNVTLNGTLDLAGYAQTINALTGSGSVTNSSAGTAILSAGSQNSSSTFSGNIQNGSGAVALTKIGSGVLTLAGTNTYSGATTISTGTLQVGSLGGLSSNSTITIDPAGTLDVNGFNATMDGLLGTGTITNNGSSAVTLTAGSAGGTSSFDGVIQDGTHALSLTKSGAGTLTLTGVNTYSGATTISNGTISVANPGAGGNLGTNTGPITLGDATHQGTLSYTGNADLGYTRGFSANAGGGEVDITTAAKTLTIQTGGIATSGVFTFGGAGNVLVSSAISGAGGITKANNGTLVLATANSYSGDTTISTGTLQVTDAGAIPSGTGKGNVAIAGAGTLDVNNLNLTINGLSGSGLITNSQGSPTTLSVGGNNSTASFSGVIQDGSGVMSLTKIGNGIQTLAGANTYSGTTTVSAGTLQAGAAASIPSGAGKGNVVVSAGGTLDLNNFNVSLNGLSGGGLVTNNSGISTLSAGNNDQSSSFTGNIQDGLGVIALTKTGTGTLTLSGNNTFSGATLISAGTLSMGSATGLSAASTLTVGNAGSLDLNGNVIAIDGLAGTGSITNNSATPVSLTVGSSGGSGTFDGTINDGTGVIELVKTGSGTVTLTHVNTYSGGTVVNGGLLAITSYGALGAIPATPTAANIILNGGGISASNTFEINSNRGIAVGPASGSGSGILDASVNQTLTYNGIIANNGLGIGGLTKTGLGTVTLGGANTYSGDTVVTTGSLQIGNAAALPSGAGKGNLTLNSTLDLNNTSITVNGLSGNGTVSNTKTGAATLTAGANDQTSTFSGSIQNGNGLTSLAKTGAGTLALTGNNTFTGGTAIAGGVLSVSADANLGGAPSVPTTGSIAIAGGAVLAATDTFELNANRGISVGPAGNGTLDVASSKTVTYAGAISGTGGFSKSGSGTLVLNGNSTYSGATSVDSGVMVVDGSVASSSGLSVKNGATLTGTGTTGSMTIQSGGVLAPGDLDNIGVLAVSGQLTLGGIANFQLGSPGASHSSPGYSDRVNVTGDLVMGGQMNLINNAGAGGLGSAGAGSYKVMTYTGTSSGSFDSVTGLPSFHGALHDVTSEKSVYIDLYNYAVATVTPTADLGRIHAGGAFGTQVLTVSNTAGAGDYTETLGGVFGAPSSGITATGSVSGVPGGSSNSSSMLVGISDNTAGAKSGSVNVNLTSQAVSGSGLGNTVLSPQGVNVSGFAYTGQSTWVATGSGEWGNNTDNYAMWDSAGGAPGLDGALSANDTATFGSSITSPATVSLNGDSPSLKSVTFNSTNSYTLVQGTGGAIHLNGNGADAMVTVTSGNHTISAPIVLDSAANLAINSAHDSLTIAAGGISGASGISKTGAGLLAMTGSSTYTGTTTVSEGTVLVNGGLGNTATTVASGAVLAGTGTIGGAVTDNGIIAPGDLDAIGTLTAKSLDIFDTLAIRWDGTTDTIDKIAVSDMLSLRGTSTVSFTGMAGSLTQAAYVFASYGSLNSSFGQFGTVQNAPAGYAIDYNYGGLHEIALVAVPEPPAWILFSISLTVVVAMRRRRDP